MPYNTGNPIPSSDAKDLSDNAENLDNSVNTALDTWTDRLGVERRTIQGQLKLLGYTAPDVYAGGLVFTIADNMATIERNGTIYAPKPSAIPFTTTGTWLGDDVDKFFVVQGLFAGDPSLISRIQFTIDILSDTTSPQVFESDYYSSTNSFDSGAKWIKTGNTGAPGIIDIDNGVIYNAAGEEYIYDLAFSGGSLNIKSFGAVGDGVNNDAPIIQSLLNYAAKFGDGATLVPFRRSGMSLYCPNGCYRLDSEIQVPQGAIKIHGTGRFHNYPQVFEIQPDCLPTFMPVHTNRNAFTIDASQENKRLVMQDVNIVTLETGDRPTAAIGYKSGANFVRDSVFERVGIFGFESSCDIYNSGGAGAGVLTFRNCAINRNTWIMRCLDGQICNKLIFKDNEAGQNTYGLDVKGHAITIEDNVLESVDDAIKVQGSYRALSIKKNYFEANGGDYVINTFFTKGADIGPNFYNTITAKNPLILFKSRDSVVTETDVLPNVDAAFDPKSSQGLFWLNTSDFGQEGAAIAKFWDADLIKTQISQGVTEVGTIQLTNPSGFHKNVINSAGSLRSSAGSGVLTFNQGGLSVPANTWVGTSILVTYDDDVEEFPRALLRLNGATVFDAQFSEYDNATATTVDKLGNRTVLYTVFGRTNAVVTDVQTQLYPWGLNPTAGLAATTSAPFIFTQDKDYFKPFIPDEFIGHSTAIPSSSAFPMGWIVKNKNPQPGEKIGWVNADNGGGTTIWKGFGVIDS